ncbi:MAG: MaoC family dehydratase N-terminal domain-containing protein, partial [Planctomycetes bacterium]|nr:MaoC family dehydratase N-terminal domain-containing protein [Planctomycetota bacterium]
MSFVNSAYFFDDLEIGQDWESQARTVTETDIVNFAGLSGDFNPIHMDHEYAKTTPYRQPIAHGLLVFSIGSGLAVACPAVRTIAFVQVSEWNFRGPVFIGDTIRIRSRVLEKT